MITFQEMIRRLTQFWEKQGCIIHQGYDLEIGAGTMNPATFLRCLGPEPYRAAYIEPCRRPTDGRYGKNPNRLQHYFQYQVILKPSPLNLQELYIESLTALGIDLSKHDLRFVHDDWENPTIGAWGLGWEVWIDGMEITQYTYFQSVGGIPVHPVTGELTYGIERLGMYLQNVDSIFDLKWNDFLTYGDIYLRNEVEWSHYNFEEASTEMWSDHFNNFEREAKKLVEKNLPIPAYEFVMKSSHAFNLLDARGAISVSERTKYIGRIRELAKLVADRFIKSREEAGFPLSNTFPPIHKPKLHLEPIPENLLKAQPGEKADFLLEIGSEELPAAFIPIGQQNLERAIKKLLDEQGIGYDSLEVYGSPRRLALLARGMAKALAEKTEEKRGPALDKAFDAHGALTSAGQGFFRSIGREGVTLSALQSGTDPDLSVQEIKGVAYLFAQQRTPGRSTAQMLAEKLPALILGLDFPKKMRWADFDITYPRPLRWIVTLLGDTVVPMQVGPLVSGNISWGHRQIDPHPFTLNRASEYLDTLRKHHVMVDPDERRRSIHTQLDQLEKKLGLVAVKREQVLSQVVYLVEWPQVTEAPFNADFLSAPKEVLISEMVEHQKYFPMAHADGSLSPHFVITADTTPSENIKRGNQKVLSSRLSDGVFLYEKGFSVSFDEYNEKLKKVTFLSGFGSIYDKVQRLIGHSETLQQMLGISNPEKVHRAALLSKADLVSEMVFEFPELQGTIGRHYALRNGEDPEVAQALEEQWMPRGEKEPLPQTETGIVLSLSEKIDNLLCCFAGNLKPSSSSDPYALRRQALGIIKILIQGKYPLLFKEFLARCCRHFLPKQIPHPEEIVMEIEQFFINRIKTVFLDYGFEKDEIEASLSNGFEDIYDTFCKVQALHRFRSSGEAFGRLFEVYKRAKGQINNHTHAKVAPHLLVETAEKELHTLVCQTREKLFSAMGAKHYDEAYALIATLQPPLARLFDEVRILAEDAAIRENRIALLQDVFGLFGQLLDFGKIK